MITLRQKMIDELKLCGFAQQTIRNYVASMMHLVRFFNTVPGKITNEQVKEYLLHKQRAGLAPSSMRNAFAGIRFFYHYVLKKPIVVKNIPSIKTEKRIPNVLSLKEVERLISTAPDILTKTLIMCMYGTGIRISEMANLKFSEIDSDRMTIKVLGKGNKERFISMSDKLLVQMRECWKEHKSRVFLFEGRCPGKPYHRRTLMWKFEVAKKVAGIKKTGGTHILRHSFATHLIEAGVPIYLVQKLLGHSRIETTTKYLSISHTTVASLKSPLDLIVIPKSNGEVGHG